MVDIYIKDKYGKLILSEKIQEKEDFQYEKTVVITNQQILKVTITLNAAPPTDDRHWTEKELQIFYKIIELISKDLSRSFSIEELADYAGMNRTKLQAGFKQVFNKTINSFTQELKMQSAKNLISRNKGYNLKEIASMLGYKHANHFSVAFKKRFNVSPSAFKKID
ncbi:MAG: AraC family transcriptional regulator [Candidatus Pedobacter colombiensis]|uniref:AraC family transcriptional regulator n=1 Tax=Candidatus Pedobacter colombiensis TaxID=3121371 RepID=A0AAJ6B4F3_9SPHI|nr:AraC family transcriptional regulator [Pedobacter sp.]WEK17567.1 MAG: AraC family transcriptional regulator [Pedobacter sp.]